MSKKYLGFDKATQKTFEQTLKNPLHKLTHKAVLLAVLIFITSLIVLAVHWPALSAKAITFDDEQYFVSNPLVQNPGWNSAKRFLLEVLRPSTVKGYYQPLTMISLMADRIFGARNDNLMPLHRTSLILHIANTALIVILLYLLFGNVWAAAGAGLLFGLHPMTVESIAWIGERKTLLASFFSLWSLILYILYTKEKRGKLFAGAIVMYVLALMSKPTSTPLPLLMPKAARSRIAKQLLSPPLF